MRISDWSSDVCSSDLERAHNASRSNLQQAAAAALIIGANFSAVRLAPPTKPPSTSATARRLAAFAPFIERSEEHTSELQSLMRISYAVFCLKTKKQTQPLRPI